jgi:hypothetical protein
MTQLTETPTTPPRKGLRAYVPSQNFSVRDGTNWVERSRT